MLKRDRHPMYNATRLFAIAASLVLLATPAAWACDELMDGMSECSRGNAAPVPKDMACHEADQALMDCCAVRAGVELKPCLSLENERAVSSVEVSPRFSLAPPAVVGTPGATDRERFLWREPERFALFSSYLI